MKNLKVVLCTALMLLGCFPQYVLAKEPTKVPELPVSSYHDMKLDIDSVSGTKVIRQRNMSQPSYMSPYITSVKNQNPYSTCWAFAFMGASESSLISEGLADKDVVDLSEWHLTYFLSNPVADPLKGTAGDEFFIVSNDYLNGGGSQEFATFRAASWCGPVKEQDAPYTRVTVDSTAVLDDDLAYDATAYHLENSYWISMTDRLVVKQMIQKYGACSASYYDEDTYYSTGSQASMNQEKPVAVYCPRNESANHAITIVGWDDNYSKDNFGRYKPQSNGAWYCKNSWGENWSKDGYFWLSYEDVPLNAGEAFVFDYGTSDNYDNNYQYDGGVWSDYSYDCDYSANVYTAQKDEYLRAVGFYTRNSNYNCKIKIFKLDDTLNPVAGELLLEQEANQLYAGFHTVNLSKSVELKKNDLFSVVIYQSDKNGNSVPVFVDSTCEGTWYENVSVAEAGQSFVFKEGYKLSDISEKNENCRIKAYTDDKIHVTDLNLNKKNAVLYTGEKIQLEESVIPENASVKDVVWSSSNEEVAMVDQDGNVTAKKAGDAIITCSSSDDNMVKAECQIVVKQWVTAVKLDYAGVELAVGDILELNASIIPADATEQSLAWSSEDEEIAVVSDDGKVEAVGFGTTMISCVATDRNERKAICKVTVYKRMKQITMEQSEVTLTEGERVKLNAITNPSISDTKGVYWISSNRNVVKVDDDGLITAVSSGENVEIKCLAKDGSGVFAVCHVNVNPKVVVPDKKDEPAKPDENKKDEVPKDTETRQEDDSSHKEEKKEPFMNGEYRILNNSGSNPTVELIDGSTYRGIVIVPSIVKQNGITYKVVSIGTYAFKNNNRITKIVLGKNITRIEKGAFQGCKKLSSVSLNNDIEKIDDNAFYECKKLNKIVIPSKVKFIGKRAFYKCKKLKSIQIKTNKLNKKRIGKDALKGIHKKAVIKVPDKNLKKYKQILKKKGIGKQVKIIKK